MGRNPERDARALAARKKKILAGAFKVFSGRGIDSVSMNDVAAACGIGCATLYRHYNTKPKLAVAVAASAWENQILMHVRETENDGKTAAARLEGFVDALLDLYRLCPDALRYELFFEIYARNEVLPAEELEPYTRAVGKLRENFGAVCRMAQEDHTVRTDLPEDEMFFLIFHLILSFTSHLAAGTAGGEGISADGQLAALRSMILRECEKK